VLLDLSVLNRSAHNSGAVMFQIDACMQLSLPGFGGSTGTLPGLALGQPWLELQVNLVTSSMSTTVKHDLAKYIEREHAS
jgi:hypothetical protein